MQSLRAIGTPYKVKINRIFEFQQKERAFQFRIKPQDCNRIIGHSVIRLYEVIQLPG